MMTVASVYKAGTDDNEAFCYWFEPGSSVLRKERFTIESLFIVWDCESDTPDELEEYRKNWD
jgi:hypothetical protein